MTIRYHILNRVAKVQAAAAKLLQLCPTLCDPIDSSPPGSAVPGILQARTLEWVAISFCNAWKWKVKVKSFSCVRLCSLPRSSIHGIFQARVLEWVAFSFSSAWKWKVKVKSFSHVWLFATPWTAAYQAPPYMVFSKQEYWSGVPFPSPVHESEKWKWSRSVVSDSSRPHGLQPTRLLHPWDFQGKSTGVGCHCLLE